MYWKYEITYYVNHYAKRTVSGYVWATCKEDAVTRLKEEYGDFSEHCSLITEAKIIEIENH